MKMSWQYERSLKHIAYDMACHHHAMSQSVIGGLADVLFMIHGRGDILTPQTVGTVEITYNACREMLALGTEEEDVLQLAVMS